MNYVCRKQGSKKRVGIGGRGDYFVSLEPPVPTREFPVEFPFFPDFGGDYTHPAVAVGLGLGRVTFGLGRALSRWGYRRFKGNGQYVDNSTYIQQASSTRDEHGHARSRSARMRGRGPFIKGALGEAYAENDPTFAYTNVPKTIDGTIVINDITYPCEVKVTDDPVDLPVDDSFVIKLLSPHQKEMLQHGPLAVVIHFTYAAETQLYLLNPTMDPFHSFRYLNEVGPLVGDDRYGVKPLGTPYTPTTYNILHGDVSPKTLHYE